MTRLNTSSAPGARVQGRTKRSMFFAVTLLLPFALLVALELVLRLGRYSGDLDFVVTKHAGGREWYCVNRNVAQRYFAQAGTVVPEPSEDVFAITKGPTTKRIFCLGESTMAGFPYEFNATAPGMLRDRLKVLLPQCEFEVVNAGLSAVGSHVVADLVPALAEYQPDLFIIYLGHNEFYGAYGAGSNVAVRGPSWLTTLTISLLRFRTFLLLRDAYVRAFGREVMRVPGESATLMEQVVGSEFIQYRGPTYQKAEEEYRSNLRRIIQACRKRGIPVMFCALVSNVRDQRPFEPMFSPLLDSSGRIAWQVALAAGDSSATHGNWDQAITSYRQAIQIDSGNADGYYRLGKALYVRETFEEAKAAFTSAKDLDGLRFRASEDFQRDLLETCSAEKVPVARIDSAFEAESPHDIIGSDLVLEHLHPNLRGYALMAKALVRAIAEHRLLVPPQEWRWSDDKSDEEYRMISMISEFDQRVGEIKIGRMTRQWPFAPKAVPYEFVPRSGTDSIVLKYAQGKIVWSQARYELAEYYAGLRQFGLARRECLAVAKAAPYSYEPLLRAGDYFRQEGRNDSARILYRRSIDAENNPFAHLKLSLIHLEEGKPAEAAHEIELGFQAESSSGYRLRAAAAGNARYLLGIAYAQIGKIRLAEENFERSVAIDPTNQEAVDLLRRIREGNLR